MLRGCLLHLLAPTKDGTEKEVVETVPNMEAIRTLSCVRAEYFLTLIKEGLGVV